MSWLIKQRSPPWQQEGEPDPMHGLYPLQKDISDKLEEAFQAGKPYYCPDSRRKFDFSTMKQRHRVEPDEDFELTYPEVDLVRVDDPEDKRFQYALECWEEDAKEMALELEAAENDPEGPKSWFSGIDVWGVYPSPFSSSFSRQDHVFSKIERTYILVSNAIRRKVDWQTKFRQPDIWAKWQSEITDQFFPPPPPANDNALLFDQGERIRKTLAPLTPEAWEILRMELDWISARKIDNVEPSAVDGVWQSDSLIPSELISELQAGVAPLESVPDHQKDWHPGSNNQVLDLVHPSLYPLVYGVSRKLPGRQQALPALQFMGGGDIINCPFTKRPPSQWRGYGDPPNEDFALSVNYQWLPAEFDVDKAGKVRIMSYINNLHPIVYRGLYTTIADVFEKFLPLFQRTLDDLTDTKYRQRRFVVPKFDQTRSYPYPYTTPDPDEVAKFPPITPRPVEKILPEPWVHDGNNLKGRKLQVIVKLANIVLTPENPTYPGGAWHVEGMQNERIIATGIYYYESKNITESLLSFRRSVNSPTYSSYDPDNKEQGYIRLYHGIINGSHLNEALGSVETKEGRCIAFPNLYQHQVQPFELIDKSKPGVRKILVFFLVDPVDPVLSTANVPPQQREWYADALRRYVPEFRRLPSDIVDHIVSFVHDCPMSLKEAHQHRAKLMHERKFIVKETNDSLFERPFSLCEH